MRHYPRTTRIAIATLYFRVRDRRRQAARLRAGLGTESPAFLQASASEIEARNALEAVKSNIGSAGSEEACDWGDPAVRFIQTEATRVFLRMIATRGRILRARDLKVEAAEFA